MNTRKGNTVSKDRASRQRKQKFYANRFTKNNDADVTNPIDSATARKLQSASAKNVPVDPLSVYRIINFGGFRRTSRIPSVSNLQNRCDFRGM